MSARLTLVLCATVASVGLTGAKPTFAQSDQATSGASTGLEEIVVTSRRREERVQTVPLAVTAFSQATIEKNQIYEIHDLAQHVPSLAVSLSQSDSNALYSGQVRLRGLPGTAIYLADVPIGNADYQGGTGLQHGLSEGNFYDLEDVEVVKGPQGTLFGKNSVGGLISIQPHRPTNDYEGYLRLGLGNYDDKEIEGAVNIPIIQDKLLLRIAGQAQDRSGYTIDRSNGKDLDNKNYYAWRVGILVRPTDDIQNYFMYDGYFQNTHGSADIVSFINPKFVFAQIPLGPGFSLPLTLGTGPSVLGLLNPATAGATVGQAIAAGGFGLYQGLPAAFAAQQALGPRAIIGDNFQKIGKDYFYGFTDVFTWDVNDNLTIKNIAAARIFKQLATDDYTPIGSAYPILNIGVPGNNVQWGNNEASYTEEFQLQGKSLNNKLTWVAGGFLQYDHPIGDTLLGSAALGNSIAGAVSFFHFHIINRSRAAFVHGEYDLGDYVSGLKLTAGYRYTFDEVSTGARGTSNSDAVVRNAAGVATNCTGVFNTDNNCYQSAPFAHFSAYGWNASLEEQLTPDLLLYVRAGNAYRPGGSNLNVTPDFANFGPEHITDVEIGVKADWDFMGMHARTNADLYHSDYKAIQVQRLVTLADATGALHTNTINLNAASATIEGGEFEGTFLPFKGVEISPHASYIFPKYDAYPVSFSPLGSETPFLYVPKWSYGITGTYHLPVDESWGDIALSATYSWYGHQYVSVSPGEIYLIAPSYELLDVRADWTNVFGYPADISFFMKNALDTTYVQGAVPIYTQLGFTSLTYNPPRMFGFNVKYRFSAAEAPAEPAAAYVPPPVVAPAPATPKSYLVFFDFNKSDLTPQAVTIVNQAAANAGPAKVTKLEVTGHTDTVGSDAYNMRLSRRRAESVAAQLEKDGIPSSEIEIIAKGKRDLLVPTADGVREPQNRRVQIVYEGGPTS
ncbi:MAG: putative TonB-dependent receptor [Rhodospirillales bacterium]|nr:putative TonB-dependent receptor [Rhodospirillales bacterium]